ncbi:MAG: MFS transporter, partial [Sphingobium sp.]
FAVVATAIYPLVYRITSEPPESAVADVKLDLGGYWRALRRNRAFWILILATVSAFVCSVALGKSVLYYFKYYLDDEAASRPALLGMSAVGLVAIPAWVWITKFIGKRNAWFAGTVLNLVMLAIFATHEFDSPWPMTIWLIASSMGSLGLALTFWSMLPDTVEYGEWMTGKRTESFIFGLFQFFLKVALGVGAGVFGWLLDSVGYVANAPQTPETLAGIKAIMIWLPGAGMIVAGLAMFFYPIRRGDHEAIVEKLAARRRATSQDSVDD